MFIGEHAEILTCQSDAQSCLASRGRFGEKYHFKPPYGVEQDCKVFADNTNGYS